MTAPPGAPALAVLSADPRVLAAWHAGLAEIARYGRRARDVLAAAQAGDYPAVFEDCGGHEGRLAGLAVPAGTMLPGWRMNGGLAVPDPAIAAGRWVAAALREAHHPGEPWQWLPGLPSRLAAAPQVPGWRAALHPDGGALYAGWDQPAGGAGWGPCDQRLWAPATGAEATRAWAVPGRQDKGEYSRGSRHA